ncbi:MAG TPA: hypothetical protein VK348_10945 [Planctomycetota bacterium]|nr:hypothetical protein [Planctomycetota bacterium]
MSEPANKTHADLMPRHLCPSLRMKHMLTQSLDERMSTPRQWPGDGYYWCVKTCSCVGPDDAHVHPGSCLPGRSCHDGPQS